MQIVGYHSIRDRMRPSSGIAGDAFGIQSQPEANTPASTPVSPAAAEDSVSFSEKALAMARARKAEDAAAREDTGSGTENGGNGQQGPLGGLFDDFDVEALGAVGKALESVSGNTTAMPGRDSANQNMEALKKQIETAQAQLDKANQDLQKAQTEARSNPAVVSEEDSGEVKDARNVVSEANNRLMQLQEQMNRAMRNAHGIGPGGGGQIQGTRAGTGGVGKPRGHIGEATDPYAAARAAEAAEMGGIEAAPDTGGGEAASGTAE